MRLWPYQMLDVLPRKQLLSQLRECAALSVVLQRDGKTNHMLINKIMDYDIREFRIYCKLVVGEFHKRGYKVAEKTLNKLQIEDFDLDESEYKNMKIFEGWHNDRYLKQCIYNLQEKYDCNGLTDEEWNKIVQKFNYLADFE